MPRLSRSLSPAPSPGRSSSSLERDAAPRAADAPSPRHPLRSRNRRGEGDRRRADILAAATGLLDRGDQRAVTLRAVAGAAGIAAPSIHRHFPGRPAILLAVVREAFADLSGRLRTAVDDAGDDAEERLHAACIACLDFADTHPERYRAVFGDLTPRLPPARRSPTPLRGLAVTPWHDLWPDPWHSPPFPNPCGQPPDTTRRHAQVHNRELASSPEPRRYPPCPPTPPPRRCPPSPPPRAPQLRSTTLRPTSASGSPTCSDMAPPPSPRGTPPCSNCPTGCP
ncbi:TetR/AcrR family transcriptional regulator [Streptomyces sp. NPDC096176]|uniref:TetR/AcrR family transcriptional regulator n=1 Tax=Streptomyces sp. NPDC096176 TaxID=3366079 RepID=UPI0037FE55A1